MAVPITVRVYTDVASRSKRKERIDCAMQEASSFAKRLMVLHSILRQIRIVEEISIFVINPLRSY